MRAAGTAEFPEDSEYSFHHQPDPDGHSALWVPWKGAATSEHTPTYSCLALLSASLPLAKVLALLVSDLMDYLFVPTPFSEF